MASRMMSNLAAYQLTPVLNRCHLSLTKARRAKPMWFRWAFPIRVWQRSTAVCCFRPRWYSSIPQARSAKTSPREVNQQLVMLQRLGQHRQCGGLVAEIANGFGGGNADIGRIIAQRLA